VLVAVLAGSYNTQDGFNAQEAGGNPDTLKAGDWGPHQDYVFADREHVAKNVQASRENIERMMKLDKGTKQL
jgi:hypothetical protein